MRRIELHKKQGKILHVRIVRLRFGVRSGDEMLSVASSRIESIRGLLQVRRGLIQTTSFFCRRPPPDISVRNPAVPVFTSTALSIITEASALPYVSNFVGHQSSDIAVSHWPSKSLMNFPLRRFLWFELSKTEAYLEVHKECSALDTLQSGGPSCNLE